MNEHGKGSMRGGIRRQGLDSWQIRVYNRSARRNEYFTITGTLKDARDARNRRLARIQRLRYGQPDRSGSPASARLRRR